jgi:hypothetical protein
MNANYNNILYIGKDTTLYDINAEENKVFYSYHDSLDPQADKIEDVEFKIIVDTSSSVQILYFPDFPDSLLGPQIQEWMDKNRRMVNAYPVYIWNSTDKITSIPVQGVTTATLQEAKDENGIWRPIQYAASCYC